MSMGGSSKVMDTSLVGSSGIGTGSGMGSGGFGGMLGLNPSQLMVYQVLQQCQDEQGVNRDVIYQQLAGKTNQMQVK